MSPKLKNIFKIISLICALLAGGGLASCNVTNFGPTLF